MAEFLARNHTFAVATASGGTYTTISGISEWGLKPDSNDTEVTNFDDAGYGRMLVTSRKYTLTLKGFREVDGAGARDACQAACEAALKQLGTANLRWFKITCTEPGSTAVITMQANGKMSEDLGGGNDDAVAWGVECSSYGKPVGTGAYDIF